MKAVAKKGASPAPKGSAGRTDRPADGAPAERPSLAARLGPTKIAVAAVALVSLVGVGGYFGWNALPGRKVDYERQLRAGPAYREYQAGLVSAQQLKSQDAEDHFQRALAIDPTNAILYNALATVYVGNAQYQKALTTCETGVARAPNSPDLYYTLGLVRYQLGRYDEAVQALDKSLSLKSDNPNALLWRGRADFALARGADGTFDAARLGEAAGHIDKAIAMAPDEAEYHAARAEVLYAQQNVDAARQEYEKAVALDPKGATYRIALGKICDAQNDLAGAEAAFAAATQIDRLNADAFYGLGLTLFKEGGRDEEAIAAFRSSLKINQLNPDVHQKLSEALARAGQPEEAAKEDALARQSRAAQDSIDQLRQLSEANPSDTGLLNKLGSAQAKQGKYDDAMLTYQRVLGLEPKNVEARYQIAGIEYTAGNISNALQAFEGVDRLKPGYRWTNYYLAQIYGKLGQRSKSAKRQALFDQQKAAGVLTEN